ncbi:MAG: hypothetical protein LBC98_10350 [Prevotellaceae bacterium]|jgi:hypothetical protein|nr:hypothetical protein [Prevotellaceae bacterium]
MFQSLVTYIIIALAAVYAICRIAADFKQNKDGLPCDYCEACRLKKELLTKSRKSKYSKGIDKKSKL